MERAEEFSEISAKNLNELCLKARYVDRDSFPDISCMRMGVSHATINKDLEENLPKSERKSSTESFPKPAKNTPAEPTPPVKKAKPPTDAEDERKQQPWAATVNLINGILLAFSAGLLNFVGVSV